MTDLEKFIDTYKQFGIEIKTIVDGDTILIDLEGPSRYATHSLKFDGHPGFYSSLAFTLKGKFISQGFWE